MPRTHTPSRDATGVHSITSAAGPHTQDMSHRMKVYALQQGLRIVCIVGVVFIDILWVRILLCIGAAVLPWVAVMMANRGADRSERTSTYYRPPQRIELPTVAETQAKPEDPETVIVDGEFRTHEPPKAITYNRTGTSRN
ncbi:DUF3099 domain-containing protein [Kocuria sp. cx-455]|uniref:DUF3099 domain-containing protein n=1 Tax=Kocuria sp. cx-455 TaxID=2771377 RepID=UPI0016867B57|nr:DUF3099 domain-containing protein [Kocuria sp. cx-455]MBD2764994.1 DUF3099 domain-containing protein [Kocuria sp. cx-455]